MQRLERITKIAGSSRKFILPHALSPQLGWLLHGVATVGREDQIAFVRLSLYQLYKYSNCNKNYAQHFN